MSHAYTVSFQNGAMAYLETEDVIFQSDSSIKVTWYPDSIFPMEENDPYTVDIILTVHSVSSGNQIEKIQLDTNIPNSGLASVSIPKFATDSAVDVFSIQITISATSESNIARKIIGKTVRIWTDILYLRNPEQLQSCCSDWLNKPESNDLVNTSTVEPCPPNIRQASTDNRFEQQDSNVSRQFHPGSEFCFQQRLG